ncbi:MAG: 5'-nucleotidase (lipoprotein e(P4) family) [Kiritimatiellia bacterium]|jgi:5'-nucleotidase (lipoprotein e(P4) family)
MRASLLLAVLLVLPLASLAKKPKKAAVPEVDLATRWVHDAPEYKAVVAGTYASAIDEILHTATRLPADTDWAVVSDADETLIDNSSYQLEVHGNFTSETWAEWEARGDAVAIDGAVAFVARVHQSGGRMAFITNRKNHDAGLKLLKDRGLWADGDRLCVKTDGSDKTARRTSVREGTPTCGWDGRPMKVLAYLGDQVGDFPSDGEVADDGLTVWGRTWFMLPNPMYGKWAQE